MKTVKDYIRTIPDFPEKGIMFRDVTSVIQDADGLKLAIDEMIKRLDGLDFDVIAGAESRGFVFGMPIAYALHKPFVMVRKAGKLPCETVSKTYDLEYGTATIELVNPLYDLFIFLLPVCVLLPCSRSKYNIHYSYAPNSSTVFVIKPPASASAIDLSSIARYSAFLLAFIISLYSDSDIITMFSFFGLDTINVSPLKTLSHNDLKFSLTSMLFTANIFNTSFPYKKSYVF